MRIFLIEDDGMIGKAMLQGLVAAGFAVDWVQEGQAAERPLTHGSYDLAILDLGLPRRDGMTLLADLRAKGSTLPVLIVTARDAVSNRIAGLDAGADDYLLKPFDMGELVARIRAILRRHAGSAAPQLVAGQVMLDPVRKVVTLHGDTVALSARELALLEALMQRPGAVLSRQRIEESIYSWDEEVTSNAVEVHLHNLRKKLGSKVIRNVRGVGYRISTE